MLSLKKKTSKLAFKSRVLTTFGKLDEQDIEEVNGCSERLVTQLMDRYGRSPAHAQAKVDGFCTNQSDPTQVLTTGQISD